MVCEANGRLQRRCFQWGWHTRSSGIYVPIAFLGWGTHFDQVRTVARLTVV
jgi:hypothetical protein